MKFYWITALTVCAFVHIPHSKGEESPRIESDVSGGSPLWVLAPASLKLRCVTDDIRDNTMPSRWYKDEIELPAKGPGHSIGWELIKNSAENVATSTLSIPFTRQKDAGEYRCEPTEGGKASIRVEVLSVSVTNANLTTQSPIHLQCQPDNLQVKFIDDVIWTKNGSELSESLKSRSVQHKENFTLEIEKPKREDAGQYECVFPMKYQKKEDTSEAVYRLVQPVHLFAAPYIKKRDKSENLAEGDLLTLDCLVLTGHPLPDVVWMKDKKQLDVATDDRIRLGLPKKGLPVRNSQLKVYDVVYADRAKYNCIANNSLGNDNITVLVRVKDKLAPLWPFLAIVAEVIILCIIIFICEKKRTKTKEEDDEVTQKFQPDSVENKGKDDVRQRKM